MCCSTEDDDFPFDPDLFQRFPSLIAEAREIAERQKALEAAKQAEHEAWLKRAAERVPNQFGDPIPAHLDTVPTEQEVKKYKRRCTLANSRRNNRARASLTETEFRGRGRRKRFREADFQAPPKPVNYDFVRSDTPCETCGSVIFRRANKNCANCTYKTRSLQRPVKEIHELPIERATRRLRGQIYRLASREENQEYREEMAAQDKPLYPFNDHHVQKIIKLLEAGLSPFELKERHYRLGISRKHVDTAVDYHVGEYFKIGRTPNPELLRFVLRSGKYCRTPEQRLLRWRVLINEIPIDLYVEMLTNKKRVA